MSTPDTLRSPSNSYDISGAGNDSGTPRRGNALSNKLSTVLSSSYVDSEIRDALRLYDARYGKQPLTRDLDLKYEAQKEVIEANARIIDDFSIVAQQLTRVGALIETLDQTCDDIRRHVQAAKQETAPMLEEASSLLAQKRQTEQKQQLLDSFCKHFLLSDADLTTLTNSTEPINERFFEVLARVRQIHKDCELLLGYENQRLGLELMEETARNLNAGYKKLFNNTVREFKGLDLEDPHISGSIRRSLRALSLRPALFQSCLDFFAEARQSTVSDAFQTALTDSTMGAARAIDFSTHDPLRYIGDMLAWVHSATVSEMEALEGLFISDADEISRALHEGKTSDPFTMPTEEGEDIPFDGHAALNSLISRDMTSVAHTMTQRISLTVRNLSDPVDVYKAYNVLSFYHDMFVKLLRQSTKPSAMKGDDSTDNDNTLLATLTALQSQTFTHFQSTVLETLHSSIDDSPAPDLGPPAALQETLAAFVTIAQTRGPALILHEFRKLYATFVAPVLTSCADLAILAGESPTATPATSTIYKLNYTSLVRDSLASLAIASGKSITIEAANEPLRHAQSEIVQLQAELTDLLSQSFLESCGIFELQELIDHVLAAYPSAKRRRTHLLRPTDSGASSDNSPSLLDHLAQRLDTFLSSALMDAQDSLVNLRDKAVSSAVLHAAVESFCERFEVVVRSLEELDEESEREMLATRMGKGKKVNGSVGVDVDEEVVDSEDEEDVEEALLREVYPRTVEEVRALLS